MLVYEPDSFCFTVERNRNDLQLFYSLLSYVGVSLTRYQLFTFKIGLSPTAAYSDTTSLSQSDNYSVEGARQY